MQFSTTDEFLEWARERDVVPNARYSKPDRDYYNLHLSNEEALSRYWVIPRHSDENHERETWVHYVSAALTALDEWQTCGLLKKERGWSFATAEPWVEWILESLGVPTNHDGALFFERSEFAAVFSIAHTLSAFGWCNSYDLFIVPDHGRQMIAFDHDLGFIGHFADEQACAAYTERLAAKEVHLPTRPPGDFMYWQDWMGPKPDDWKT